MRVFLPFVMVAAVGCTGDDDDKETGDDTGMEMMPDDTAPPPPPLTYSIEAEFVELTVTAPEVTDTSTLCATLIDPTPILSNGDAIELAAGQFNAEGTVTFEGITAMPTIGMIISLDDCPDSTEDTIGIATSTGVLNAQYADAKDGSTVEVTAFGLPTTLFAGLTEAAAAIDDTVDLSAGGFMMGFALDGTTSPALPVAGVTVSTNPEPTVWYLDAAIDKAGFGPFAGESGLNTETQPLVGAFLVPNAGIGAWSATDTSGTLAFGDVTFGGFPDQATVIAFLGAPAE